MASRVLKLSSWGTRRLRGVFGSKHQAVVFASAFWSCKSVSNYFLHNCCNQIDHRKRQSGKPVQDYMNSQMPRSSNECHMKSIEGKRNLRVCFYSATRNHRAFIQPHRAVFFQSVNQYRNGFYRAGNCAVIHGDKANSTTFMRSINAHISVQYCA